MAVDQSQARLDRLEALIAQSAVAQASASASTVPYWAVRDTSGLTLTVGTDWNAAFTGTGSYTDSRLATAGGEIKDPRCSVSYQVRYLIQISNSGNSMSVTCYLGEPGSAASNAQISINGVYTDYTTGSTVTLNIPSGSVTIAVMIDGDGDRGWLNALIFDGSTITWTG